MNNERDLVNVALKWHIANVQRLAISADRRRLAKEVKAKEIAFGCRLRAELAELERRLTLAKRKELAALRQLAKACASQRGALAHAEVVDFDVHGELIPWAG